MTAKIKYANTTLTLAKFLVDIFPTDMPLDKWPTFCGAGEGFGDKIVPDHICGVNVSCTCLGHDVGWILCRNSYIAFSRENWQFYQNLRKLVHANAKGYSWFTIERRCFYYYFAVQTVGLTCFQHNYTDVVTDPFQNPEIKAKLHKLAMTNWELTNA